jgi:opacity protein-like surface antigen
MRVVSVLAATIAFAAAPAHAGETYGKLFGGATLGSDHDFTAEFPGPVVASGTNDTDVGYTVGGALGYNLTDYFALEGELAYRSNEVNGAGGAFAGDDDLNALSLMANAVLKAPIGGGFTPYAGAGAGGVRLAAAGDDDIVFAYQAFGGIEKELSPKLSAGIEYRYLDASEASFVNPIATVDSEYDSHGVNLVLTRKF